MATQRGKQKVKVQHKRSKIRSEGFSKEYQSAVSEPSLQVLVTNGLTTKATEGFINDALQNPNLGAVVNRAGLTVYLQTRSLLCEILRKLSGGIQVTEKE